MLNECEASSKEWHRIVMLTPHQKGMEREASSCIPLSLGFLLALPILPNMDNCLPVFSFVDYVHRLKDSLRRLSILRKNVGKASGGP